MKKNIKKLLWTIGLAIGLNLLQQHAVLAANIQDQTAGADSWVELSNEDISDAGTSTKDALQVVTKEDYSKLSAEDIVVESVSGNAVSITTEAAPTAQEVYNKLMAMKAHYPEGMFFDNSCPAGGYLFRGLQVTGINMYGYGCAGFAFILSDVAFGDLPARTIETFNWDGISVGDILRVNHNSHSVIVLEKFSDYVIVAEANYNSSVHWGRKITKSQVENGFTYYQTRYPEGSAPDNNSTPSHSNTPGEEGAFITARDARTGATQSMFLENHYYKVLVFGGIGTCGNTMKVMEYLTNIQEKYGLKYTEMWAFDIKESSDTTIKNSCIVYDVGHNMKVINGTDQLGAWSECYYSCMDAADAAGLLENNILYMPLVVFADDEGNILDMTVSGQTEAELEDVMSDAGFFNHESRAEDALGPVEAFVSRLYTIALKRNPEPAGLADWTQKLVSGSRSGAEVASGIFFSPEFKNRNLSDEDFVETLYLVMMDRPSDAGGKKDWVYKLKNGVGREGVFSGFTGSTEFDNICKRYGIRRGEFKDAQPRNQNPGLTTFVSRLYTKALGRQYEVDGLNYWCDKINSGAWNINDVSTTGFFNSPEFMGKNTTNDQYVRILYRTFFDREADAAGYADWMNRLNRGVSRNDVLKGFANSQEFANLKKTFGL